LPDIGSALLVLGAMSLSGFSGALAHDLVGEDPRAFGPVDPRLRDDGEAIVAHVESQLSAARDVYGNIAGAGE
jgi:hypothetical protein